jgi:exopolysaccharide biosynthesis protein
LDGKPFRAYYAIADIKEKKLQFTADTTHKRRMTPTQFYAKNVQPLLVVNTTFFSFTTNKNLNTVIKNGQLVGFNVHSLPMKGKDTFRYRHPFGSAIGISKKREADIAWLLTDSAKAFAYATQVPLAAGRDSVQQPSYTILKGNQARFKKWKMRTAVGGGPVLVQDGQVKITNNEELKFAGNAINDKHPRTLMGYTQNNKLIIMVIEGRHPGTADGASLLQAAKLMADIGCVEALNLDGGGSSCMLINGKETIRPSDKGEQRAVPAVFIINSKGH